MNLTVTGKILLLVGIHLPLPFPKSAFVACCRVLRNLLWQAWWTRSDGWHNRSNYLRISNIGLEFGGVMHSTMEQIPIWNSHKWPILHVSQTVLPNHPSRCLGQVKSYFERVKFFYNHMKIENLCLSCPNILKMGIQMGTIKSLGRTLTELWNLCDRLSPALRDDRQYTPTF